MARAGKSGGSLINVIWWVLILFIFNSGFLEGLFDGNGTTVSYDSAMDTSAYHTEVVVNEDNTYDITENINVDFNEYKHGIYRYIPYVGKIEAKDDAEPYYAQIEDLRTNAMVDVSKENGNVLLKLGDPDYEVYGPQSYTIAYKFTPQFQSETYDNAYYNVFPMGWQNDIPEGSTFEITFPKDFDHEKFQIYYGEYGSSKDVSSIVNLTWNGNTVSGTLNQTLEFGSGVTFYVPMETGYFTGVHQIKGLYFVILFPILLIIVLVVIMFLLFGRDDKIYPSVQYEPPDGLDSAAVGYIIDGSIENKDLISLILYWANKGFLTIGDTGEDDLTLFRVSSLPADAPDYQKIMFNKIFMEGDKVRISSLKYEFADTLSVASSQLKYHYVTSIYTTASKVARVVSIILTTALFGWFMLVTSIYSYTSGVRLALQVGMLILMLVGMFLFCGVVDQWYAKSQKSRKGTIAAAFAVTLLALGIFAGSYVVRVVSHETFNFILPMVCMLAGTILCIVLTGFMKKRTSQCIEWMGRLAGLRDYIETAELDRLKQQAETDPQWFYRVLPYTYVFGLSDVFARKLQDIAIPAPEWYSTTRSRMYGSNGWFDYYMFNRCMTRSLGSAQSVMSVTRPPANSGGSGGGFSGGGGGFSGGGFGGGGGGSW